MCLISFFGILFLVVPYQQCCCLFLIHLFMVLCPITGHCDICYWVFAFVCVPLSFQMMSLPIAERVRHPSPSLCDCPLLTPLINICGVMAGAQTQPPGLCEEQSRRCTHTYDRCTRCHYPPLIIILPVLVILRSSLAFYPAWLQNSCILTRFPYLSSLSPASLSMAVNTHQKWHQKAELWAHLSRK